jgi:hypothetical protein
MTNFFVPILGEKHVRRLETLGLTVKEKTISIHKWLVMPVEQTK